jgi:methionine aminotransferase
MISKLPQIGHSIFTKMTAMANEVQAINLSQGFPSFNPDEKLVAYLQKHIQNGKHQYAPATGIPELRSALSHRYGYHPEKEITVTSGASEALFCAITASVNPGDEVIVFEPCYDLYVPAILLQGGIPKFIKMNFPEYKIDWDFVEKSITGKTKVILINTPHNPTGKVLQEEDLKALIHIAEKHPEIIFISDEVYEYITFDEHKHLSLAKYPQLRERTFVCSSFAKTYHITGWKTGYCLAPPRLTEELRKIHQYITFCNFTAAQYALADYISASDSHLTLSKFYEGKREVFLNKIDQNLFGILPSQGTFFQNLVFKTPNSLSDTEISEILTRKAKIASIPISVFYQDGTDHKVLRFCLAKEDEILTEAVQRLNQAHLFL